MDIVWAGQANPDLNAALARWLAARIWGDGRQMPECVCMGVFKDGVLQAAVAFQNWQPAEGVVEFAGASINRRWLTRPVLWAMFNYAFNDLGCQLVVGRNDPDNHHLNRMEAAYGFEAHFIPRMRGRDKGEVIMTLTDDAWRANGFHKENG